MSQPAYRDSRRGVEERVQDLVGRMTALEKIAQLTSVWLHIDPESGAVAPNQNLLQARFDPAEAMRHGIGQITRPFGSRPVDPAAGAKAVNALQRRLIEETRLGIPAICHEECLSGFMAQGATSFPSPLNYAATWDPVLIERVGTAIGRQMRAVGAHQGLAPVADVARDARWGRIEETLGEDPYLVGRMVTHYVRGLQGPDIRHGVVATLKHFAGYSFSEGGRNFAPAHVGRREFTDVFLLPFEMAVREGGALSVMNAYQDFDGEPPAASHWLLTEVLRQEWGFDGLVVADYGSVTFLYQLHRVAAGRTEAAALALKAGLDVELPNPIDFPEGLKDALAQGLIDMADLDRAVSRVLRIKFRLGLFESPYVDPSAVELNRPEDQALAAEVARKSMTLLSNNGLLPLSASITRLAVLGPNAHDRLALFGNYSFENHVVSTHYPDAADRVVTAPTVLEVLRRRLPGADIRYAAGCRIMDPGTDDVAAAAALAREADAALVVVGDRAGHFRQGTVGEGTDATDLSLPGGQAALLEAVLDTGTPTVVVLLNGRPFALTEAAERAAAVLEAWFPGQAGAEAIADVLFGDLNPGGKTTLSFSRGVGLQPAFYNHKFLSGGIPRLPEFKPVFPFGHGLSYTRFAYTDLALSAAQVPVEGEITATCVVKNIGERAGDEVVQLYVQDLCASVTRPVKELKGFVRLRLEPGQDARVRFTLPADLFAFTGPSFEKIVEPGDMRIMIGASSEDIRLQGEFALVGSVRLVGPNRTLSSRVAVEPLTKEQATKG
jgi:beta-glucosidase